MGWCANLCMTSSWECAAPLHLSELCLHLHPLPRRAVIGVCPQFDVLWGELTGEQHLHLYGSIKVRQLCLGWNERIGSR